MANLYNLVRVQTASTGTGTLTLGSALPGYLTFAQAGASSGETVSYGIIDSGSSEVGTGTYTVSGSTVTLTRSVTKSTNSNNAISVGSGAIIYSTARSNDILNPADLGTGVQTALAVNVGSAGAFVVNGGALGTPSSGTVTNLTGTASININGTVGATTPTTGAFTTVVASSTATAASFIPTSATVPTNGMYLSAANTLGFATNSVNRIIINSSGLGIGNTPTAPLQIDTTVADLVYLTRASDVAGGVNWYFRKCRNTIASPNIVQNGDFLGAMWMSGYDGSAYQAGGLIRFEVDGTPGAGDMPGRMIFGTTSDGSASPVERFRVDNKGNVIVNTAALSTSATDGFLYIPTSAGAPIGTPSTYTGRVAMEYDTTNNKLYVYNGAWKSVTLA